MNCASGALSLPVSDLSASFRPALHRPIALPPLRLTGGLCLRDGAVRRRSLAFAGGRITKGPLPAVDLDGFLLLPGIVDLGADPVSDSRAGSPSQRLAAAAHSAAANGVTTGWLTQGWSSAEGSESPEAVERLLAAHAQERGSPAVDLRLRLRVETHATDTRDRLLAAIRRYGVDQVVFADSSGQAAPAAPSAQTRTTSVPRFLCALAEAFDTMGVTYGSLADPDGETRERFSMIGAGLADSPGARSAAAAAKAMNEPVILPAASVVSGGPAMSLVGAGLADALRSGPNGRSLLDAVFALVDRGWCDLPRAWALVSAGPAAIMGLVDRGTLDHGKRADIVVIDPATRRVEMTIARGHLTYLGPNAAARLNTAVPGMGLAAE